MRGWAIMILALMFSCRNTMVNQGKLLAKVGGAELYENDLKINFPQNSDSTAIKRKLVNDWVRTQLTYKKAMSELTTDEKNKDKELKSYYESLIRYTYLERKLTDEMDTVVNDSDVLEYYKHNQKNFELKRNIIRFLYVKIPIDVPMNRSVKYWMQNPLKKNLDSLKNYSRRYASNALLDTAKWYYFSDITKEIPILQDYNPEHFIKNDDYVELKDGHYLYQFNIVDGRIKEETAPLALVKDKIRTIIANQRKTDRIKEIENEIFKEGAAQHQFEKF
jgi:hypothetical protein